MTIPTSRQYSLTSIPCQPIGTWLRLGMSLADQPRRLQEQARQFYRRCLFLSLLTAVILSIILTSYIL